MGIVNLPLWRMMLDEKSVVNVIAFGTLVGGTHWVLHKLDHYPRCSIAVPETLVESLFIDDQRGLWE